MPPLLHGRLQNRQIRRCVRLIPPRGQHRLCATPIARVTRLSGYSDVFSGLQRGRGRVDNLGGGCRP